MPVKGMLLTNTVVAANLVGSLGSESGTLCLATEPDETSTSYSSGQQVAIATSQLAIEPGEASVLYASGSQGVIIEPSEISASYASGQTRPTAASLVVTNQVETPASSVSVQRAPIPASLLATQTIYATYQITIYDLAACNDTSSAVLVPSTALAARSVHYPRAPNLIAPRATNVTGAGPDFAYTSPSTVTVTSTTSTFIT